MSDETVDTSVDETTEEQSAASETDEQTIDWKDRFEGQRKVNRDLERKYREASESAAQLQAKLEGREAEHQATAEAQRVKDEAIIRAELKAAAKGRLADPLDALAFVKLDQFSVDSSGDVDVDALNAAIDDLLERKSHLAAPTVQRRFDGDADAGKRGDKDAKPRQLSREDLKSMTPAQIVAAQDAGQLNEMQGIS